MAYRIRILAVGKVKQPFYKDAIKEYLNRIKPFCRVIVDEVPEMGSPVKEGEKLLKALKESSFVIALDERGELITSVAFSEELKRAFLEGMEPIFVIGGVKGLSDGVKERASRVWALSRLTFTHELARVILFEQIYRAFKIIRGEPYHY